jgi:hypothetical protein
MSGAIQPHIQDTRSGDGYLSHAAASNFRIAQDPVCLLATLGLLHMLVLKTLTSAQKINFVHAGYMVEVCAGSGSDSQ